MKKILGLDLGVSSIGWALVNEAEESNESSSIIKLGVRVNPLTVDEQQNFEKGKSITTNADRRLKRGMRRNLQRYKLRRENLIECLKRNNIINDSSILCENGNRTTFETYNLRAKAVNEKVSLNELARILLMINKKRGYKSSRKAKSSDEGNVIDGMNIAKELYNEGLTPGEYIYRRLQKGKQYIPDFYRSDLHLEFDKIYNTQKEFYPDILTDEFYNQIEGKSNKATYAIFKEKYNILSTDNKGKDKKLQLYRWRNDAVHKQLEIETVAYTLSELNREISNSSGYLGAIGDRSKELYFSNMTIGQILMQRLKENPNASLTNIVYYRQDYLDEFEKIWETQKQYHKELTDELKKEIRDIIIFYQRNLKSQKGLISLCEFEQKKIEIIEGDKKKEKIIGRRVCPKSSPLFQEFKIWQILNNVIIIDTVSKNSRPLEIEEKELLFKELNIKEKLNKQDVLKLLLKNYKNYDLNYEQIEGNRTLSAIITVCQQIITATGHDYCDLNKLKQEEVYNRIEQIFKALGYRTDFLYFNSEAKNIENEPMFRLWHLLYSYAGDNSISGEDKLYKKISELCNIEEEYAKFFANIKLQDDYGNLSSKAISNILPHLKDGNKYSVACAYAGYNHSKHSLTKQELENKEYKTYLEILQKNSLRNPVVEKILNQMINVVNAIILEYGSIDEIRIEMARELKSSKKEREEMTLAIANAGKENDTIRKELQTNFGIINPSRNDIVRYKLYKELEQNGYKTLYSDTYIPREELFSKKFDIEHIIPQSRLFDDSFSNKTLEARDVNIKKGDKTAYDFVVDEYNEEHIQKYKACVERLYKLGAIKKTKHDKLLMQNKDIPQDFIERDLRDTQYIAKKAREILESIVPVVLPTTGKITDRLREDWQLTDVMQELNWDKYSRQGLTEIQTNREGQKIKKIKEWNKRNDHRHHAMDALTIAFTKRNIIQYLNNLNAKSDKSGSIYGIEKNELNRDQHGKLRFKPPFEDFRRHARLHLENILVSIKSKSKVVTKNTNKTRQASGSINKKIQLTPRGQLHLETVYGSSKRYITMYEKVGTSFTFEHIATVANKREREALLSRLNEFGGDAKKAFTGKNSLEKNPIYLNKEKTITVASKVKLVKTETIYTIRKNIDKDLNIDKVTDSKIKKILQARLQEYNNNASLAFSNLDQNPIWLNKEKGIKIKRVTITGISNAIALHDKKDHFGNIVLDKQGRKQPTDYVNTGNNHHVAIYVDENGNYQENIVSFYEATARAIDEQPIIDKEYNAEFGWKFCFSMKQNEYFVFPNEETGFYPEDIDLLDPKNASIISPNLYRVQKLSSKYYVFRHHLETNVEEKKELKEITWKRITAINNLKGIVKVRINHIGEIVHTGE